MNRSFEAEVHSFTNDMSSVNFYVYIGSKLLNNQMKACSGDVATVRCAGKTNSL